MAGANIFQNTLTKALQETLSEVILDEESESDTSWKIWLDKKTMKDAFEEVAEWGGPQLMLRKEEGQPIGFGTIDPGILTTYIAAVFALKLGVSEEALEDNKHEEILDMKMHFMNSYKATVDVLATNLLVRGFNTAFPVIGGNQPVFSANHPLPQGSGGSYTNILAQPMTPSVTALMNIHNMVRKLPGHNGLPRSYKMKRILCPTEQELIWAAILGSEKDPQPGNFTKINVANSKHSLMNLDVLGLIHWDNTTTNWAVQTDAPGGPNIRFRRPVRQRSWTNNDNEMMLYSMSCRLAVGVSDGRSLVGVAA
jgi:hypothetical protein